MRAYLYKFIIFLGFLSIMILSCEKNEKILESRRYLLTNDSVKTWHLYKIMDENNNNILLYPCITDDEYKFYINGKLSVNNMGTTYSGNDSTFFEFIFCKDTIQYIDSMTWMFSVNFDSLIINGERVIPHSKIKKLVMDTLILRRIYSDSIEQTEYYIN